jgi:hypothetical protein
MPDRISPSDGMESEMDVTLVENLHLRLRGQELPAPIDSDMRVPIIEQLTRLIASPTLLQDFIARNEQQAHASSRKLSDSVVIDVVSQGLQTLTNEELTLLISSAADLKELGACVYRVCGDVTIAPSWWNASIDEGRRLRKLHGDRDEYDRMLREINDILR